MKAHIALVAFFCAGLCAHANDKNFGSWGGSGQPCAVVTIDDQVSYNPGHSLGIRFFSASAPPEDETNFDEVRRKLAGVFAEHLGKSKFFRSVKVIPEGSTPDSDYVLDGIFLAVRRGNAAVRLAVAAGGDARIRLSMSLLAAPDYKKRIAAMDCDTARAVRVSSFFTLTRVAGGTTSAKINQLAESLAKQFEIGHETIQARATRKQPKPLKGESENPNHKGIFGKMKSVAAAGPRALPLPGKDKKSERSEEAESKEPVSGPGTDAAGGSSPQEADDDNADVKALRRRFTSFRAAADASRKGPRRVEAVWVTRPSYEAFRSLLADEASAGAPASQRELRRGILASKPHLESVAGTGLIVFLVSYEKITWFGPILWDFTQVRDSISLRDPGSNRTLRPKIVVDEPSPPWVREGTYWCTRTLLIGFPAKGEDGRPWAAEIEEAELAGEIEGVPVILRFKLDHSGASGQDLILQP
ncbi:MAG: hypothetical protein KJZ78_18690 [Bryobacteraceae bacterium]|nr:hypothetical protein [Bryobacteraceae bacterium]